MNVRLSETAAAEALYVEARLEREHPGYGPAFTDLLGEALAEIGRTPRRIAGTEDGPDGVETREHYIARFEYRVIYAFPDENTAEVIALVHARRRPGTWTRRLADGT